MQMQGGIASKTVRPSDNKERDLPFVRQETLMVRLQMCYVLCTLANNNI